MARRWNQNWTGIRTKEQQKQDMEGGGIDAIQQSGHSTHDRVQSVDHRRIDADHWFPDMNALSNAFTTYPDQDTLRRHMHDAHLADCLDLAMRGVIPVWEDSDIILQEDEERLLLAVSDAGGLILKHHPTSSSNTGLFNDLPTYTRTTTAALGMTANANAQAVVNRALQAGWITQTYSEADGCYVLDCTAMGMIMLERQAQQKEWGDD